MQKIDINRITLGICFIVVVGIAAAKDYRVEIGGGTFKFESLTRKGVNDSNILRSAA